MYTTVWDTLLNAAIFIFWFRIWSTSGRSTVFNPLLRAVSRISNAVVGYVRAIVPRANARAVAAVCGILLLLFKGLLLGSTLGNRRTTWSMTFGLTGFSVNPGHGTLAHMVFGFATFAHCLFILWCLSLLYEPPYMRSSGDQARQALRGLARPFSDVPIGLRLLVIACLALAFALARSRINAGGPIPEGIPMGGYLIVLAAVALSGMLDALSVLASIILVLVVFSWIGLAMNSPRISTASRNWLDALMGPLNKLPARAGGFDFTPFIAMLLLYTAHSALLPLLQSLADHVVGLS